MGLLFKNKHKTESKASNASSFSEFEDIKKRAFENCFIEFINIFPNYSVLAALDDKRAEYYKKRVVQLLVDAPELVHMLDSKGRNIVDNMVAQKNIKMFFIVLNQSQLKGGAGLRDLCFKKFDQTKPACFSLIDSATLSELVIMNNVINTLGIDPKDDVGEKWSTLYKKKMKAIASQELRNKNNFEANRQPVLDSLKAVHQEDRR